MERPPSNLSDCVSAHRGVTLGDELQQGRYRLTGLLGFSPSASVWLSKDQQAKQHVAVKVGAHKSGTSNRM